MVRFLMVSMVLCVGCFGTRAREHVLWPTIAEVAPAVVADARRGVEVLPQADQSPASQSVEVFESSVAGGQEVFVMNGLAVWPTVRTLAHSGVDAQLAADELGPNGASSLHERVNNMDNAIQVLVSDTTGGN